MPIPDDIDARRFYRVARQRLEDGALLLRELNRATAAIYLTGYAVECILKALWLVSTPASQRKDVLQRFRGHTAHDPLWLRDQLRLIGISFPPGIAADLLFLSSWSTELRYEPSVGNRNDAERFIATAERLVNWADERM